MHYHTMPELVDLQNGGVSREIFVNEDIYQQEQEQVFARAWLFIGHESQIPQPGDYFVTSMGEEAVLLTRDSKGSIHAGTLTLTLSPTGRGSKNMSYPSRRTPDENH